MDTTKSLNVFGNLIKEEKLVSITQKFLPDTVVMEAPEPFPGYLTYYNDFPKKSQPLYLYFIIHNSHVFADVVRASNEIMEKSDLEFDAALVEVLIHKSSYKAIRVRHLQDYDHIIELQKLYVDHGIVFKKPESKLKAGQAIMRIKKMFFLNQISDNMFLDNLKINHGYFEIPNKIDWDDFVKLTKQVRNNWDKGGFDAAMGYFFIDNKIIDIVRIYSCNINEDYLKEIQNKYLEWIKILKK